MSTERDPELGAAIRSLPTPDHAPAFWDQLTERLAQEPAPVDLTGRRLRSLPRQAPWLGAVAAAAAVVVAVVSLANPDDASSDGAAYDPQTQRWTPLPAAPLPALYGHTALWTGQKMLVWGLLAGRQDPAEAAGAAYDPATNVWTKLSNAPISPRGDHTAVWTGSRMVIWGGSGDGEATFDDGAAYDPATDRWAKLPRAPLVARASQSAVWTGSQMLLWGGTPAEESSGQAYSDGAAYDPAANQWTKLPGAPLTGRSMHSAAWVAGRMVVWGGSRPPAGPPLTAPPTTPPPARGRRSPLRPWHPASSRRWSPPTRPWSCGAGAAGIPRPMAPSTTRPTIAGSRWLTRRPSLRGPITPRSGPDPS